MEELKIIKKILNDIVVLMVKKPNSVTISDREETDEEGEVIILSIVADPSDIGILIGTKGTNASALRRIISSIAYTQIDKRVYVQIEAPKRNYKL